MRNLFIVTSLLVLCSGCGDMAARQQRAEDARRAKSAAELKALGQAMHNKQAQGSTTESTPPAASEKASDAPPKSDDAAK